jgi:hypothetical protein
MLFHDAACCFHDLKYLDVAVRHFFSIWEMIFRIEKIFMQVIEFKQIKITLV